MTPSTGKERAQQPDIAYILITNVEGTILADSDLTNIGKQYRSNVDLGQASRTKKVEWRQVAGKDGSKTFEVFRQFLPIQVSLRGHQVRVMRNDWCRGHMSREGDGADSRQIIFLGLDMGPVEAARPCIRNSRNMA